MQHFETIPISLIFCPDFFQRFNPPPKPKFCTIIACYFTILMLHHANYRIFENITFILVFLNFFPSRSSLMKRFSEVSFLLLSFKEDSRGEWEELSTGGSCGLCPFTNYCLESPFFTLRGKRALPGVSFLIGWHTQVEHKLHEILGGLSFSCQRVVKFDTISETSNFLC